jgi:hypothetical protein
MERGHYPANLAVLRIAFGKYSVWSEGTAQKVKSDHCHSKKNIFVDIFYFKKSIRKTYLHFGELIMS